MSLIRAWNEFKIKCLGVFYWQGPIDIWLGFKSHPWSDSPPRFPVRDDVWPENRGTRKHGLRFFASPQTQWCLLHLRCACNPSNPPTRLLHGKGSHRLHQKSARTEGGTSRWSVAMAEGWSHCSQESFFCKPHLCLVFGTHSHVFLCSFSINIKLN